MSPLRPFRSPNMPPPPPDHHAGAAKQDFGRITFKVLKKRKLKSSKWCQSLLQKAFDHSMGSSVIPFSSYYTAPDHPPHHTSGLFAGPSMATGHSVPRSALFRRFLPGSIDEPPRSSFVATSQRVFGFSTTTSERASQANPEPTPFLTTVANLLPYTIWGMEGA
jgi:hypothetical protein